MRDTRAFTLIEVLVTVVLLSVGLLGSVTALGVASRMITAGQQLAQITALASRRMASLQSRPCGTPGAGERVEGPFHVRWTASQLTGPVGHLAVRVAVQHRSRTLRATLSATYAC